MAKANAAKDNLKTTFTRIKTLSTPDGVAAFPKLREPDEAFGKRQYTVTVVFDPKDAKYLAFAKLLKQMDKKFSQEIGRRTNFTAVKIADENRAKQFGVSVGSPYIMAATSADKREGPIPVYGPDGEPTAKNVYGSDLVSAVVTVTGWENNTGAGIKLFLEGVQLLERRWKGNGVDASKFVSKREEYIQDEDDDEDSESVEPQDDGDLEPEEASFEDADEDGDVEDNDPTGGLV